MIALRDAHMKDCSKLGRWDIELSPLPSSEYTLSDDDVQKKKTPSKADGKCPVEGFGMSARTRTASRRSATTSFSGDRVSAKNPEIIEDVESDVMEVPVEQQETVADASGHVGEGSGPGVAAEPAVAQTGVEPSSSDKAQSSAAGTSSPLSWDQEGEKPNSGSEAVYEEAPDPEGLYTEVRSSFLGCR